MKNIKLFIFILFVTTFIGCTNQVKKDLYEDSKKLSTIHKVITFYDKSEQKGFLLFVSGEKNKTITTITTISYGFGEKFSNYDDTLFLEFKNGSKTVLLNQSTKMREYIDKTHPEIEGLMKNDYGQSTFNYFLDGNIIENNPIMLNNSPLKRITLKKTIHGEIMSIEVDSSQEKFFINYF